MKKNKREEWKTNNDEINEKEEERKHPGKN